MDFKAGCFAKIRTPIPAKVVSADSRTESLLEMISSRPYFRFSIRALRINKLPEKEMKINNVENIKFHVEQAHQAQRPLPSDN